MKSGQNLDRLFAAGAENYGFCRRIRKAVHISARNVMIIERCTMARKKNTNEGMDNAEIAIYVSMAIEDMRRAAGNIKKQENVFEELERQIGRAKAIKYWPGICKQLVEQQ